MRSDATHAVLKVGTFGEQVWGDSDERRQEFERLGWGVAPNPRHDLGTDLWLMARDERLYDLGLVVGAQVKSGPSYFKEEKRDESGVLIGWWYRDSTREHIDAWLGHGLPHLIVLHDLSAHRSYYAHVIEESVVSTGKGAKILVRVEDTVDDAHREDLLRVAAAKKSGNAWEGSAWTGAGAVSQRDLLRHALIVPRLVAPHPNTGRGSAVTASQALALLVQVRLVDLLQSSEQNADVPTLQEAAKSSDWSWRFVGAMGRRVTAGEHLPLVEAAAAAPSPDTRTAATVAAAATMLEDGLAVDALALLDAALRLDDAEPVDHAWLLAQQARACAEIGRLDEARHAAVRAQSVRGTHAGDVTATAIAGVAALLLFNTSGWGQREVGDVVTGADTTAAWWRTQTVARGLTALTDRTFWSWSRDTTHRITTGDPVSGPLLSAALTASFAGDHGTWRHLSGLLGQDSLLRLGRDADPDDARTSLETLRLSGNEDDLKHAVRRLANDGPAAAVSLAANAVDLDRSTRTTARADLALLERGGDLLGEAAADRGVTWLLTTLDDPAPFVARTSPSYLVADRLLDTLARVVPAASAAVQQVVAERIADLPAQTDQSLARAWGRIVRALPEAAWPQSSATRAGNGADDHHGDLATPLLEIAARADPTVRQRLLDDAGGGSLDALAALGDVTSLPSDIVQTVIRDLAANVEGRLEAASKGVFGYGGHDFARGLALLNIWHPALAQWQPLMPLIEGAHIPGRDKADTLRLLAGAADRIPEAVKGELLAAARAAAAQPAESWPGLFGEGESAAGPALELIEALAPAGPEESGTLTDLLAGDMADRMSAARIATRLRRSEDVGMLLVLVNDPDPDVRANAAYGLGHLVTGGQGGPSAVAAVRQASRDPGRVVPRAVADALSEPAALEPALAEVLTDLRDHPSAAVRRAAAGSDSGG